MDMDTKIDNDGRGGLGNQLTTKTTWSTPVSESGIKILPCRTTTEKEAEESFLFTQVTGNIEKEITVVKNIIQEIIEKVIKLIDEVLEIYDDKMARDSTFTLVEENIKLLWNNREKTNEHFRGVLVYLLITARNAFHQNYEKKHYESIKSVFAKLRKIYITSAQEKECISLLGNMGIDLVAPLRDWENYTINIKKIDRI
jgi:hypothetical protein